MTAEIHKTDPVTRAGQLVGLVGVASSFVYAIGALVLLARLWLQEEFSQLGPVTLLPRGLVLAIGIIAVVLPVVVGAALVLLFKSSDAPSPSEAGAAGRQHELRNAVGVFVVVAAFAGVLPLVGGFIGEDGKGAPLHKLIVAALVALATTVVTAFAFRGLPKLSQWMPGSGPVSLRVVEAVLLATPTVGIGLALSVYAPLPDAEVCVRSQTANQPAKPVLGKLIGETSDRVYVGIVGRKLTRKHHGGDRVISIPSSQLTSVAISQGSAKLKDDGKPLPCA